MSHPDPQQAKPKDNGLVAVTTWNAALVAQARVLARDCQLPLILAEHHAYRYLLVRTEERLELQVMGGKPLFVDFLAPQLCYRLRHGGGIRQHLARAVGLKSGIRPTVLDLTAGLGTDAFILASLGCQVTMVERSAVVGALLADGLTRLKLVQPQLRLELFLGEAQTYLANNWESAAARPEVIYLDPMYPPRAKAALGKQAMRILQELVGADSDSSAVFALALQVASKRVVVKRPQAAASLTSLVPNLQLKSGGSSRYDIYLIN